MSEILLNVADVRHRSEVNGPGLRSVVWVQGCSRKCPGCINPHTHPHKPVKLLDPKEIGLRLANIKDTVGFTISGGEPFEQALACAILSKTVKEAGKSVMVFTGFPFEQLKKSTESSVQRFLKTIDLVVAGPFVQELKCKSKFWRASSNQTVHFLNCSAEEIVGSEASEEPVIEIKADGDIFSYTGFPDQEDLTWFDQLGKKLQEKSS
ncbi:MAG: radical SAM protein [Phycisphaerae bacterium]|nr:radical SAM protein [Phycisphaerae bacterium]